MSALFLTACVGKSNSSNDSNTSMSLELNKTNVDYLAYKIADENWIEVIEKVDITISGQQSVSLANICVDSDSESYSSQAVVHNIESLTDNNITVYDPKCGFYSGQNIEGRDFTITSQQEEIAIGAASMPNTLYGQDLEQELGLSVLSEESLDIAVIGISQEEEIYIYKSLNNTITDIDNIIIDFYSEDSVKVIEFQELPLNNWDYIDPLYTVDNLLIPLSNNWQSDSENSNPYISIPEALKKEGGRYICFPFKITGINDYRLEARFSSASSPIIEALPDDLSSLNSINLDYSEDSERYTLSVSSDISSIIPLPTNSFTIEKSSSHRFNPRNPSPPYWDKKQITTSYIIVKGNTISLNLIEFHLLPNSPIDELSNNEISSLSSRIIFMNEHSTNKKSDFYKLSRNLNEFINN